MQRKQRLQQGPLSPVYLAQQLMNIKWNLISHIFFFYKMKNRSPSSFLPIISKTPSLNKASSPVFPKPLLSRIHYPPVSDKSAKQNYNSIMLQSCIANKRYDDVLQQNNQKKIQQGLQPSDEGSRKNLQPITTRVGKQAPINYYHQYKLLERTLLKKEVNKLPELTEINMENPVVSLLEKADSLRILPLCLGLVKSKGQATILNVNNYNLGDRYILALAAGLKKARSIQKMYFNRNRITDISLSQLSDAISPELTVLELGHNKITTINKKLLQLIIQPEYRLQSLGIASNFLKQSSAETVLRNVRYSKHIKRLDLRDNRISSNCQQALAQLIEKTICLQELYIGVNYLGRSGETVFNKVAYNKTLRVLDYSLNQLGEQAGQGVAQAISNCLKVNKSLQHLDLSFNNFSKEASQIISSGLEPNKTLLGFHFKGNYGYVNAKGFLILADRQGTYLHSVDKFQIDSFEVAAPREHNSMNSHMFRNVCWICEGWYQRQFKLSLAKGDSKTLVYIHFDFQKYEPRLISLSENVKYVTMVPPRRYRYFFTVNNQLYLDKLSKTEVLPLPQSYSYEMDHVMRTFKVQNVNYLAGKPKKIANEWKQINIKTLPRTNGLTTKKEKIPWSFGSSVWAKQYKLQDEQMLRKCFQRDWKCSKLTNLVKNQVDQDKVKDILWKAYSLIKNLYKQFSSWSPFGDIWAVSSQPFTEFCQQSKIINKEMPLKIIDLTFITTNSMSGADWKGNLLNPERGMVRFQYMQALVRLAQQKYKKLGLTDNFADSVDQILKEHAVPLAQSYNPHQWRSTKYFTQFNDLLIKKYRGIFASVYKRNSKLKVKPGQKAYMCLAQFKSILQRIGLTTILAEREIFVAFNNSMMTQVDELENQRFIRMTEIQFIQGVARCAYCLTSQHSLEPISNPPLHLKFEWMIQQLRKLCPEQIRAQFPDLEKTIFRQQEEQQ